MTYLAKSWDYNGLLLVFHVNYGEELPEVREKGQNMSATVCYNHLVYNEEDTRRLKDSKDVSGKSQYGVLEILNIDFQGRWDVTFSH